MLVYASIHALTVSDAICSTYLACYLTLSFLALPSALHVFSAVFTIIALLFSLPGMAEWWVLGNADYLVANAGSNFAATATAWGLGPDGTMLRYDEVSETMRTNGKTRDGDNGADDADADNDVGAVRTDWRRDWDDRAGDAANTCYPRVTLSQCEADE